jgi:hypothetical protein
MAVRRVAMSNSVSEMPLAARRKFALLCHVVPPHEIEPLPDSEIDAVFLRAKRVPVSNLRASRLTAVELKARGVDSAVGLRELGFDALDLTNPAFCASCVSAFGSEAVKEAFLLEPGDAVAISGSCASIQLSVDVGRLLRICVGAPAAARSVLQQHAEPRGLALLGVPVEVILDTGLRAPALAGLGYNADRVQQQTKCGVAALEKLGF